MLALYCRDVIRAADDRRCAPPSVLPPLEPAVPKKTASIKLNHSGLDDLEVFLQFGFKVRQGAVSVISRSSGDFLAAKMLVFDRLNC